MRRSIHLQSKEMLFTNGVSINGGGGRAHLANLFAMKITVSARAIKECVVCVCALPRREYMRKDTFIPLEHK